MTTSLETYLSAIGCLFRLSLREKALINKGQLSGDDTSQ